MVPWCPFTVSILACAHQVRVAVPTLAELQSQPFLLCPALEAEPACFWLPYMNH